MPYADPEIKKKYYQSSHHKENVRRWAEKHPERRREQMQRYMDNGGRERRAQRRVSGIVLPKGEVKRVFLGFCEACGVSLDGRKKNYHHWEDELLAMGMYLCNSCHHMAEQVDKGFAELYLAKKAEIEKDYALKKLDEIGWPDNWGR